MTKFKALGNRLLVEEIIDNEPVKEGSIFIPTNITEQQKILCCGRVVDVGTGDRHYSGEIYPVPFKVDEIVYWHVHSSYIPIKDGSKTFLLITTNDIILKANVA